MAIGGFADHAHALIDLGAILGIAKAVQVLKANSSRWMKEQGSARFEWQEGYFACSVSRSQVAIIRQYAGILLHEVLGASQAGSGKLTLDELHTMLREIAEGSDKLPHLPTSAFSRESFYEDRL